uniref:Centrosomal protein 128 n=1 Tax=Nothobranchius furzeri TaxID=105023 RepID=A0A8C6NJ45_NOTFU
METSSDSDSYERTREHRPRGRESHRRAGRDRGRAAGGREEGRAADISNKISTLANTLQDTSRNLTKVDRMLGQYREHADDQAEAMALLRENLEESISQLQTQRLSRANVAHGSSASTLHTSDLEARSESGTQYKPGSRSTGSASFLKTVLFGDFRRPALLSNLSTQRLQQEEIHTFHQTLRDLHCGQQRLSDDLDREILRRNRYLLLFFVHVTANDPQLTIPLPFSKFEKSLMFFYHHLEKCSSRFFLPRSNNALTFIHNNRIYSHSHQTSVMKALLLQLRAQLSRASVLGEVEELKRILECKEKERLHLSLQVKVCVRSISVSVLEMEALLQESTRSRDELKTRAQEAVRQWRAKCKRLQKELEELQNDKFSQTQLKALSQQTEAARRELAEILGRLAQREEELHRKDVELSEAQQRQLSLQQEIREEQQTRHQATIQAQLREDNQRLREHVDAQAYRCQRDQDSQAELQTTLKQMTAAHAQLSQQLVKEEGTRQELQKAISELKAKVTMLQEERSTLNQQLQLERGVHQKEVDNLKVTAEDCRMKDCEMQRMLRASRQERDEIQAKLMEADAASDKELCAALHIKLDRMKDECDKLAAQLCTKEEAHLLLHRKYQQLKQELEDKVSELRCASESELLRLEQKVLQLEAEQETVLTSMGEELDTACLFSDITSLMKLLVAETHQTKLRWMCEEVRERDTREQRLRKQHQQTRDQLKALRRSRDSEQAALLERLEQQEKLMCSLSTEKKGLLEANLTLYTNTKAALEHLESIPDKNCLMEGFKDLEASQQQKETVEERYAKYKGIVQDLQHQLDESKHRIQEYRVHL